MHSFLLTRLSHNLSPRGTVFQPQIFLKSQNVKCKKVDSDIMNSPVVIGGTEDVGLMRENLIDNASDAKMDKVFSVYDL